MHIVTIILRLFPRAALIDVMKFIALSPVLVLHAIETALKDPMARQPIDACDV
jgi:hypothetical protein